MFFVLIIRCIIGAIVGWITGMLLSKLLFRNWLLERKMKSMEEATETHLKILKRWSTQ